MGCAAAIGQEDGKQCESADRVRSTLDHTADSIAIEAFAFRRFRRAGRLLFFARVPHASRQALPHTICLTSWKPRPDGTSYGAVSSMGLATPDR